MRTLVVMACFLALGAFEARADYKVKDYKFMMASTDKNVVFVMRTFVNGLGAGIAWANTASEEKLYCQPPQLALAVENYIDIINRQIAKFAKKETESKLEDEYVGLMLMMGLTETFPCGSK
jgi:hypothetical protein